MLTNPLFLLSVCYNSVLNMKALVGAFKPEEGLGLGTSCNNDNALTCVTFPEELHAHDGENEDNDTEDEGEVTESTNSFPHDGDEKVECWPRLCKFEHS